MKGLAILVFSAAVGLAGAQAASAAPFPSGVMAPSGGIILVDGGCGPGGFRDYYGYCRPKRFYAPPPPRYFRCPYGFRPTPYGCRPF